MDPRLFGNVAGLRYCDYDLTRDTRYFESWSEAISFYGLS